MPNLRQPTADKIDFAALMEPVACRLLGEPNTRLSKPPKDIRFGTHGSLSIDCEDGKFYDHENARGGGVVDLVKYKLDCDHITAVNWLRKEGFLNGARPAKPKLGIVEDEPPARRIVATYDYVDETGALLFQAVRYEPKEFRQRRPDGKGGWAWDLKGVRRVLYHLPDVLKAVASEHTVFVVEGEKDADNLHALGFTATTNPMGANKWQPTSYSESLRGADVVVIGDHDQAGRDHVSQVAKALHDIVKRLRVLDLARAWPECPEHGDISQWIEAGATADKLNALVTELADWNARPPRLQPLTLSKFFSLAIKPREMLLAPIIPEKGLAMLYASRGTGKTHIALGIAYAVATGTAFLRWKAPKPRRVLLIDGEMPAAALQERLANIVAGITDAEANPDALKILAGDLIEEGGIGNLASPQVQAELEHALDTDLLILDNLSSLTAVIRDNDAESWGPIQDWLLRLRRKGLSVLIVHHAGKGGQQRGTSRREDVLDTSISLRRPQDYTPAEGARFEVHLEKARGILGDDAKPFEAKLEVCKGSAIWTTRDIEDVNVARVKALLDDGLTVRDIADETGLSKSAVQRIKKKIKAEGGGSQGETDETDGE